MIYIDLKNTTIIFCVVYTVVKSIHTRCLYKCWSELRPPTLSNDEILAAVASRISSRVSSARNSRISTAQQSPLRTSQQSQRRTSVAQQTAHKKYKKIEWSAESQKQYLSLYHCKINFITARVSIIWCRYRCFSDLTWKMGEGPAMAQWVLSQVSRSGSKERVTFEGITREKSGGKLPTSKSRRFGYRCHPQIGRPESVDVDDGSA